MFFLSFGNQAIVFEAKVGTLSNKNHAFVRKLFAAQASGADKVKLIRPSDLRPKLPGTNETDKILKEGGWIDQNFKLTKKDELFEKKVLTSDEQVKSLKKFFESNVEYIDRIFKPLE